MLRLKLFIAIIIAVIVIPLSFIFGGVLNRAADKMVDNHIKLTEKQDNNLTGV